jgi:hypothetical protein
MFNVRPDQLWPWIRFKPPSSDPPGFRMAADGSIRDAGNSGPVFPGYGSGANPSAPFDTGFGNAYRAASSGFDGQGNGAGPIPSLGSGSLAPFAASLLFPRLTEPQTMVFGPQGHVGEPEARPDRSVPGLHHFKPPADDPPGFRVAADGSVRNGSPNDPYLWSLGYDPHADITLPTGISSDALRPFRDGSNPFELLDQRRVNTDPVPSFDGGSLPSHAASLLFPRMTEPRFAWTNLVDDGGEIDTGPDDLLPGFRVEPSTDDPPSSRIWTGLMDDSGELNTGPDGPLPGLRIEPSTNEPSTSRIAGDDSVGDFNVSSFGYDPVSDVASRSDARSAGGIHPGGIDTATYLLSDPIHFLAHRRDPVQEALDQIARLYCIDWQGSDGRPTMFHGAGPANGPTAAVGDAFDPRYVVPTQARGGPLRPPPGPGHNGGPPLRPDSTSRVPTQPSRTAPSQANPPAQQPPDNSAGVAGTAAAGAAATEQLDEPVPPDPEAAEKLEAWQRIISARGNEAPDGQYLGPGGVSTWASVRLSPKLPEPAAGRHYLPAQRHLRDGYRGELQLANRIVTALPNETVIHYGMPAGRQGPDVISISRDGVISVWDSKWRSGQRSISPGQRAHQSEKSLKALYWEILNQIRMAVRSGRLPSDVGAIAMKNIIARNFDIYTIGTGNAHSGVAQSVRNGVPTDARRP